MSQENEILSHLKAGNKITQYDALVRFGCFRLGARIYDLKKAGHNIATEMIALKSGKRVARYELRAE